MPVRLTGALVAALALLTALPAAAAAELSRQPQKVYDDYRSDAAIEPCEHTVAVYRRTLKEITPDIEEETPAFRPAVEAAKRERERGRDACLEQDSPTQGTSDDDAAGGSSGGSAGSSTPSPTPQPSPSPERARPSKPAPAPGGENAAPGGENAAPAPEATPAPTVAPPPVTDPAPPAPAAPVLLNRPYEGTPIGLLIALGLLALSALLALLALLARRLGWGEERLAGLRHAWGEATYRAGATWADFVDWIRLGRGPHRL